LSEFGPGPKSDKKGLINPSSVFQETSTRVELVKAVLQTVPAPFGLQVIKQGAIRAVHSGIVLYLARC
jgi:hypothetical protein